MDKRETRQWVGFYQLLFQCPEAISQRKEHSLFTLSSATQPKPYKP